MNCGVCRLQMQLGSCVAVAVVQAGSCSPNLTSILGTSICHECGPKKTKTKIKKKKKGISKISLEEGAKTREAPSPRACVRSPAGPGPGSRVTGLASASASRERARLSTASGGLHFCISRKTRWKLGWLRVFSSPIDGGGGVPVASWFA